MTFIDSAWMAAPTGTGAGASPPMQQPPAHGEYAVQSHLPQVQQPVTDASRTSPDSEMSKRRMVSLPFRYEPGRPGPANGAPRSFEGSREHGYLRPGKP